MSLAAAYQYAEPSVAAILPATGQDPCAASEVELSGQLNAATVKGAAGGRVVPLTIDVLGAERQVVSCLIEGVDVDRFEFPARCNE